MCERERASRACMDAVTCLMTQCLLKDEVAHLLVQPREQSHHLHFTAHQPHTHTHTLTRSHAHKQTHSVTTCCKLPRTLHLSFSLSLSVTLHLCNPFPILSISLLLFLSCVFCLFYLKLLTVSLTLTARFPTCTAPLLPHIGKVLPLSHKPGT